MSELEELEGTPTPQKDKSIIEVDPKWPFWQRTLANLVNASFVFIWVFAVSFLLYTFNQNEELVILRDAMLNIIVPAVVIGILTLISAMTLVSWGFPYFSFRKLMQEGTPIERAACCGFWGAIAIAIAMIIAAGIKP